MKQFTLTLLLSSLFFSSFAQTEYQVDERRLYNWNGSPDWVQYTTEQYIYANGGNKETNILGLSYPSLNKIYQFNKTYNANNDVILSVRQDWNNSMMQWEDESQDTYTYYSGTSNLKDVTSYSFNQGHDTFKIAYEYSGNDIVKITYQEESLGSLINYLQYDYTYNTPELPATEKGYKWNTTSNMWDLDEQGTLTYTSGLRELITERYNGSTWDLFERYLTSYTISIEKDDEHIQQSRVGANWVNTDRELSEYDSNDNKEKYTWYSWSSNVWSPYYKEEMDYSVAAPLNTKSFDSENFIVYPNPVSDVLFISSSLVIDNIEMYNVLGEKVKQSTNTKQLNVESLNSGIYLLKIFSNNRNEVKRIVIR